MTIEAIGCIFLGRFRRGQDLAGCRGNNFDTLVDEPMNRMQVEKISKALADATRLRIFEAISGTRHMNCGEIVSLRGVTPATVSQYLKILSEAGLIACGREGQFVYSQAVPETIEAYARALTRIAGRKKTPRRL